MLSLKFIQENKETVIERLAIKNFDAREPIDKIIALDNLRKSLQQEAESKQAEMNRIAKEIGKLMQTGQKEEAEKARQETSQLTNDIAELSNRRNEVIFFCQFPVRQVLFVLLRDVVHNLDNLVVGIGFSFRH